MRFLEGRFILNPIRFFLLFIVSLNIFILYKLDISLFDQILNLLISFGIFNFYNGDNYEDSQDIRNLNIFQI